MTQQTSPFIEGKYGWSLGESNWNLGMDENLLKFSYLFDSNIDGVVNALPSLTNGQAWYLTTDKRLYYAVNGVFYSTPVPKWFCVNIRTTGQLYQFDGTDLVLVQSPTQLNTRLTSVEGTISSLGTAAFQNSSNFATAAALTQNATDSTAYTNALRTDLSGTTFGSKIVGWLRAATGAVARTVFSKLDEVISVKDFGAVGDGIADDSAAVRKALDSLPARGGKVVFPDAGPYYIPSVIYIPQRTSIFGGSGVKIVGNNTSIIGSGLNGNTIFESGTGQYSTVALGGATNFGQPVESVASIHYNSSIEGFNFSNCGTAIKLYNWIQGCTIKKIYSTAMTTTVYAERCFYLGLHDVYGRPLDISRAATTPIFHFNDSNNTITFNNVHASGIDSGNNNRGVGFKFSGGVQALNLTNASSEGCIKGVEIVSFVYDMNIESFYFEKNNTHLDMSAANVLHLTVNNNWFDSGAVAITCNSWTEGSLGSGNYYSSTAGLVILGPGCTCEVNLPAKTLSELTHTTWTPAPVGWSINPGCIVKRNDIIFNSAVGFDAILFRNNDTSSGGSGVVPMSYTGDCFNAGGVIPYCTTPALPIAGGTLTIDTKITYSVNLSAVRFDLVVSHSQTDTIAGVISGNGAIFRDDAVAGRTITLSNNGGFLRIAISGFATITSLSGKVRII